eukprot:TRINITY_DN4363_c0_g1_i1.p2 TRINITY_DN4363_c0_g1~~TRINITY_DN4363_c0_g1_i1.p2  ORF type:complete len:82 (-),score=0.64 TRINITY_DN4363_c0_g1_i1:34-279(-)
MKEARPLFFLCCAVAFVRARDTTHVFRGEDSMGVGYPPSFAYTISCLAYIISFLVDIISFHSITPSFYSSNNQSRFCHCPG